MVAATAQRVTFNTAPEVNRRIRRETEDRIRYYSDNPSDIERRLAELDQEWDIERVLEANAATLALFGGAMGVLFNRKWLALPAAVSWFMLQHAVQGWCPPMPVLRRLGFRTAREIEIERNALKAIRGDYTALGEGRSTHLPRGQLAIEAAEA